MGGEKGKKKPNRASGPILVAKNVALSPQQNRIPENRVKEQIARAPGPQDRGKSGYPHKFNNLEGIKFPSQNSRTTISSTTSLREYPVTPEGSGYNFDSKKPKDDPGPFRGITNQKGRYKGTICHDGEEDNPNAGRFHLCTEE